MNRIEENAGVAKARRDGFYLLLLGAAGFLCVSLLLVLTDQASSYDFQTAYYGSVCLLQHCDPYSEANIERLYSRKSPPPATPDANRIVVTKDEYPPSAFLFTAVLATLPEKVAYCLWIVAIAGSFMVACYVLWRICAKAAPFVVGLLLAFSLLNSGSLIHFANPAGFVAPLCILAALAFVCDQFVLLGIACFVVSLAVKPHDVGFVWLYFLLAGGAYRKRALQTLAGVAVVSLPTVLWVTRLSPHWAAELAANIAAFSGPGKMNDPRGLHGACMMTNLQTFTSLIWTAPSIYNLVSGVICCSFLVLWAAVALHSRPSRENAWFALAAIAPFSLLPVYHRQYDGKLILLALPALAILWARRGREGWIALAVTATAIFLNGDFPWILFLQIAKGLHIYGENFASPAAVVLANAPVPLSLLAMGSFYLWIFARQLRLSPECAEREKFAARSEAALEQSAGADSL